MSKCSSYYFEFLSRLLQRRDFRRPRQFSDRNVSIPKSDDESSEGEFSMRAEQTRIQGVRTPKGRYFRRPQRFYDSNVPIPKSDDEHSECEFSMRAEQTRTQGAGTPKGRYFR